MSRAWITALVLAALALLVSPPGCAPTPLAELPSPAVSLVQDLSMLAQGQPMSEGRARSRAAELVAGTLAPEALVATLLESKLVGDRVASSILLGGGQGVKPQAPVPIHSVLSHFSSPRGDTIYTLTDPCMPSSAVRVSPWWAPESTVLVCPSALRADVHGDAKGRSCGASTLAPDRVDLCGCGPRLMYCTRDKAHYDEVRDSAQHEVDDTVAWVVNNDIPLDELFMMNETVRDRNAEMLYRRARIAAGEPESLADIQDFDAHPRLAPRYEQVPGQQSGLLTAPAMIYGSDALRGVLRDYYEMLWCSGQSSSRVTTSAVLGLDVVDLREGAGWKQLAAMDICTDCHARLDYGMQFFHGYPSSTQAIDFHPRDALMEEGPLYARNISDPRGEDDLSPQGFARLALDQPEYGECMARKITDYVFSGSSSPDDYDAVLDAFEETRSFKPMLQAALVRFAERSLASPVAAPEALAAAAPAAVEPASEDGAVTLTPWLVSAIDDQCAHCHDGGDAEDLTGPTLTRSAAERSLEQVAFGDMPRTAEGLDEATRLAFVDELSRLIWTDPGSAEVAAAFFSGGMRAYPVHDFRPALAAVASRAGAGGRPYMRAVESVSSKALLRYSPGFAASTAMIALKVCREEGATGAALSACIETATAPEAMIVGGVRGDAP